jgi:transposase
MNELFALDKVLAVGVDPHRESLDVVGICFPEEVLLDAGYDNTPAGHCALLSQARGLAAEHQLVLVFGLEDGGNYGYTLSRYLVQAGCHVKEVNPRMTNRQRDFYGQDKSNRLDALSTAAIVMRAYERLPQVSAVQEATEATRELSRYREQLVKEQTANLNRLHSRLAHQYPGYKEFFSQTNGVTALHFWATYPTPSHLKGITQDELSSFLYEKSNHRLGKAASQEKAKLILLHLDEAHVPDLNLLTRAQGRIIRDLAQRLLQLKRSIETIEAGLEETVPATGQQLETFNGMGTVLAGVFIGETLDPARFDYDKNKFAAYNGSAPVTKGTGKHSRQVENHWCNRRLKNALDQLSLTACRCEPLSEEYYQQCLERGRDPGESRKRLARRLSDVIFAMMRDKTPYDPAIHRRKQQHHKTKGKSVTPARTGG